MASATRRLTVEILGDASGLTSAFKKSEDAGNKWQKGLGKLGSGVGKLAKYAGVGALAVGAIGATVAVSTAKDLARIEKINAQTTAVIKSTGGAAGVATKEVEDLAGSIEAFSGVEAESVQEGANLLLTFKNIKNEAGAGNKVFDRTVMAMTDMSVAMGTDAKSGAMQLGKALNDPARGLSMLSRVGITFSASQEATIKKMVETGNAAGAQKIMLKELESQFGGSAKAAGETMTGQLARAEHAFGAMAESVMVGLMPAMLALSTWLNETGVPALQAAADWVVANWPAFRDVMVTAFQAIHAAVKVAVEWIRVNVVPTVQQMAATVTTIVNGLVTFWRRFGDDITAVVRTAFGLAFTIISGIVRQIQATVTLVMAALRGDWGKAWEALKTLALNPIKTLKTLLLTLFGEFLPALGALALNLGKGVAGKIWEGIQNGPLGKVAGFVKDKLLGFFDGAAGLVVSIKGKGGDLADALKHGARDGITDVGKGIGNAFIGFVNRIIGWLQKIPLVGDKLQKIPMLANGDIINRATLAVVGEDGPEAVIPLGPKRRKRGAQLLTHAARILGMPGDFPGPASVNRRIRPGEIPMLADGAIVMPGADWAGTYANMLAQNDSPNLLERVGNFAARGLAGVVGAMPDPPGGLPHPIGDLAASVKATLEQAIRELWAKRDQWDPGKLLEAFRWARSVMGRPYVWGGGHGGWNYGLPGYDCSGFASHAAKKAGAEIGAPGTTMSLHPLGRAGKASDRVTLGFRNMHIPDPRKQHMGARILGSWFQFGNPGRMGGGNGDWNTFRTLPGMPGYAQGTPFVPATGPAVLHRGEAVIPAAEASALRNGGGGGALVHIDRVTVADAGDIDRLASQLDRRIAMALSA